MSSRHSRKGPHRYALEHAADLFSILLLRQQAQARHTGLAGAGITFTPEQLRRQERYAYAGAELALHAIGFLEMYDGSVRSPTHPLASDLIKFLRDAHRATGQTDLLEKADGYMELIRANAPKAIAMALVNAQIAVRNLREFIETGETPRRTVGMKIPSPSLRY